MSTLLNWKTNMGYLVGAVIAVGLVAGLVSHQQSTDILLQERKAVICPSFLSIARSARDTLIVMRNEPLCNAHVLENLK